MRSTTLRELKEALQPQILQDPVLQFTGIGTDTRKDLKGYLFWALKGESFDAHDFLPQAIERGAQGLVVDRLPPNWGGWARNATIIQVPDTLKALQQFASFCRRKSKAKVIGITGSNGKTSTKEFTAAVLQTQFKVHWNPGSFNNHFGLPFNLLATPAAADFVVAEMGMNHSGELQQLCSIAEPDIALCTMVGPAHLEFLGTIEKVAEAKEELYRFSKPGAIRIYNLDNPWTRQMRERAEREFPKAQSLLTFSTEGLKATVSIHVESMTEEGLSLRGLIQSVEGQVQVPVFGKHHAVNLAAAATVGIAVGMEPAAIWKALGNCRSPWGRMQFLKSKKGFSILFDGYNANPESMYALLASLDSIPRRGARYGVFGEMRELGSSAAEEHEKLGARVARLKWDRVWFYGPSFESFERGYRSIRDFRDSSTGSRASESLVISSGYEETIALDLASVVSPEDLVVVKGSRGMLTERFVEICQPLQFSSTQKK